MDEIKVSFGELGAAQQNITTTSGRIEGQLQDLRSFLAPLVAQWSGAAAESYQARQRVIDDSWRDLAGVLGQIGGAVGRANENYQLTEQRNAARYG